MSYHSNSPSRFCCFIIQSNTLLGIGSDIACNNTSCDERGGEGGKGGRRGGEKGDKRERRETKEERVLFNNTIATTWLPWQPVPYYPVPVYYYT